MNGLLHQKSQRIVAKTADRNLFAEVIVAFLLLGLLAILSLFAAGTARAGIVDSGNQQWLFQVFVDDKAIGYHEFRIEHQGGQILLHSEASFEYKLLFVTLYNYQHQNQETWTNDCLNSIESSTDANGKDYAVSGQKRDEGFVVQGSKGLNTLPECVMSFAYWNPNFLLADKLLNTQNGDYMDVAISDPVGETLKVLGEDTAAWRYKLAAEKLNMDLWYSPSGDWLGLQTKYENGRTLRYERVLEKINIDGSKDGVAAL